MKNLILLFVAISVSFSSCTTIIKGTKQKIVVTGNTNEPVNILADGKFYSNVTLPSKVKIKRKKKVSQIIAYSDQHKLKGVDIEKKTNPLIFANALFYLYAVVTVPVDLITGSYKNAKDDVVYFEFENTIDIKDISNNYVQLGREYYELNKSQQARSCYLKAIEIDPDNDTAYSEIHYLDKYLAWEEEEKRAKAEAWNKVFEATAATLAVASQIAEGNTSSPSSSSSYSTTSSNNGVNDNSSGRSTGQKTTNQQNCKNFQDAYNGHIKTIRSILRSWDDDIKYDVKHNQYYRTNKNRQLLEETLRYIEGCKKSIDQQGCSVQYNSSVENDAKKKVNFRPDW